MAAAKQDTPRKGGDHSEAVSEEARETSRQAAQEAREEGQAFADQAKEQARSQLSEQKEQASEQLGSISSALHQTSDDLRDEDQRAAASFIEGAAGQVDRFSEYLRNRSVSDMVSEARDYARREPSFFLGGAMLLGLVGARFLKSSTPRHQRRSRERSRSRPPARQPRPESASPPATEEQPPVRQPRQELSEESRTRPEPKETRR